VNNPSAARAVYRHAQLKRVLNPRHLAIVGASPKTGSFGERVLNNCDAFKGEIYLVNSRYEQIGTRRCYPSLSALPVNPDCVAVVAPREAVEPIVREAAELRVGGVILYASGYAETQLKERIELQDRLREIALASDLKVLGPNCLGVVNYALGARISFSEYPAVRDMPGAIVGIASQSGALSQALSQSVEAGVSLGHILSAGNQADVDVADFVSYLADEPSCQVIACVFEGMAHPRRLLEAAQIAWRNDKPLLIHKIATGSMGAEAAISHTGSLAGSNEAYRAMFERAGAIVVDDFAGLMEAARFFAKAPKPLAKGVAVVATSGGAAIMAADLAELHGVPMPQPSDPVRAILEANVPHFGSAKNPCDVTGQVLYNPQSMPNCSDALLSDPAYGALIVPQTLVYEVYKTRAASLSEQATRHGKIACSVVMSNWLQGPGTFEAEQQPRVALFRSMDRCLATIAAWQRRAERQARGERKVERLAPPEARAAAARLISEAANSRLTERESKAVLELYGLPVVGEAVAASLPEALEAAAKFVYPLALKIESPDIAHKTEAGGVVLNIKDDIELAEAYERVMSNAARYAPNARLQGVLLQPMIPPGLEVVLGVRIDPLLGALVVVGLGGVLVELLKDSAVDLAPIGVEEGVALLRKLRGAPLFEGFRGAQKVDINALGAVVARLSEFAWDQRELIAELDINPIICTGERLVAVDALIVRSS
jgi:acyl-CoA synthetase (NDP forming)